LESYCCTWNTTLECHIATLHHNDGNLFSATGSENYLALACEEIETDAKSLISTLIIHMDHYTMICCTSMADNGGVVTRVSVARIPLSFCTFSIHATKNLSLGDIENIAEHCSIVVKMKLYKS